MGHAVEELYQTVGQYQQDVIIHSEKLTEMTTADSATLVHWPAGVPPIPRVLSPARNIHEKNLEGTLYLVCEILDHHLKDDSQLQFHLIWGSNLYATFEPRNNVLEEAISGILHFFVEKCQIGTGHLPK